MSANQPENRHVYRPLASARATTLITQSLLAVVILIILILNITLLPQMLARGEGVGQAIIVIVVCAALLLFISFPTIVGLITYKLIVSPEGLVFNYWPNYVVKCRWEDIDRLGQGQSGPINYDVLYINRGDVLELSPTMWLRRLFLNPSKQHFIPLTKLEGWPGGQLEEDIRKYAPHLFSSRGR